MTEQEILAAYPAALTAANELLHNGDVVLKVSRNWELIKWAYDGSFQQYLFYYTCPTQNVQIHAWLECGKWQATFSNSLEDADWRKPL